MCTLLWETRVEITHIRTLACKSNVKKCENTHSQSLRIWARLVKSSILIHAFVVPGECVKNLNSDTKPSVRLLFRPNIKMGMKYDGMIVDTRQFCVQQCLEFTSSEWQLCGRKPLVYERSQRRMTWLVQADKKATVTPITTHYNNGMHKSISEYNTLNLEVDGLEQQKTNKSKKYF